MTYANLLVADVVEKVLTTEGLLEEIDEVGTERV